MSSCQHRVRGSGEVAFHAGHLVPGRPLSYLPSISDVLHACVFFAVRLALLELTRAVCVPSGKQDEDLWLCEGEGVVLLLYVFIDYRQFILAVDCDLMLMQPAVSQWLEYLLLSPKFWATYVYDTFVISRRNKVREFKAQLNSIFPAIQFTIEEEENQLPFLDVQVTKLKDSGLSSNYPVWHKRTCVKTHFQRVQAHLSDESGKKEDVKDLNALFDTNGYPKSLIRKCRKKPRL
ncbi:unnamed protein product [Dibothriocephalus latus]|uniref:Helix-turn-helix domain-containing protein n=1 Tax=Dibothriocephalus latus TaxID=60516 RepID=A0A3P6TVP1_DIBLA|nr:unnamed protein product [Dibothriocephalus latus]